MKFEEFDLHEKIMRGIRDAGFTEAMPVQAITLLHSLEGKDVTVQSQTGSGKTAAFLITIFQKYIGIPKKERKQSLIIAPTRELAIQIEDDAKLLGKYTDISLISIYGGVGYRKQEDALSEDVEIIVGTPGRLIDFSNSRKLDFSNIDILVIDEADRLFDMGFYPDIQKMLRKMGPKTERQTMLYSATLGTRVLNLAWEHMNEPVEVNVESGSVTVREITQELYHISKEEKFPLLLGILGKEVPGNAIVFTNTKHTAVEVAKRLNLNGYSSQFIMGDLPQKKRIEVLNKLRTGDIRFLIATDVAARGLHVDDLAMVINYDIPEDFENYVHRIGRTARAGKSGKAVSMACERFVYGLEAIEKYIGMQIPVKTVTDDLIGEDKSAGIRVGRIRPAFGPKERREAARGASGGTGGKHFSPRKSRDRHSLDVSKSRSSDSGRGKPEGSAARDTGAAVKKPYFRAKAPYPDPASKPVHPAGKAANSHGKPVRGGDKRSDLNQNSVEDRIAYYRKKYGEDFKMVDSGGSAGSRGSGKAAGSGRLSGSEKEQSGYEKPEKADSGKKESLFSRLKKKLLGA